MIYITYCILIILILLFILFLYRLCQIILQLSLLHLAIKIFFNLWILQFISMPWIFKKQLRIKWSNLTRSCKSNDLSSPPLIWRIKTKYLVKELVALSEDFLKERWEHQMSRYSPKNGTLSLNMLFSEENATFFSKKSHERNKLRYCRCFSHHKTKDNFK